MIARQEKLSPNTYRFHFFHSLLQKLSCSRDCVFIFVLIISMALSSFGIVMLYSTSSALFGEEKLVRQGLWIGLGVGFALILYFLDYRILLRYSRWILLIVTALLIYLGIAFILSKIPGLSPLVKFFPFTRRVNGAYRWLFFGPVAIQPGEFAKVALILFLADYYSRHPLSVRSFSGGVLYPGLWMALLILPMLAGGSLSITVITIGLGGTLMFIGGVQWRYFFLLFLVVGIIIGTVLYISPTRLRRITASWLSPEDYRDGPGYQLTHSQYAIGSGSMWGVGLNNSRMKAGYLPYSWTDFIMAVVAEELGWVAVCGVIIGFFLLTGGIFWIGITTGSVGGLLICAGVGSYLIFQAFANLAVVSGLLPTTGITIPFISYGGSSILVTWMLLGLVGSVVRISRKMETTSILEYSSPGVILVPELTHSSSQLRSTL